MPPSHSSTPPDSTVKENMPLLVWLNSQLEPIRFKVPPERTVRLPYSIQVVLLVMERLPPDMIARLPACRRESLMDARPDTTML